MDEILNKIDILSNLDNDDNEFWDLYENSDCFSVFKSLADMERQKEAKYRNMYNLMFKAFVYGIISSKEVTCNV